MRGRRNPLATESERSAERDGDRSPFSRRRGARRAVALLSFVALLGVTSFASAQSSRQRARRLFSAGNVAMDAGRFGNARDLFRESLALHPNAGTAFNLGVALQRTGEVSASEEILDELLGGRYGRLRAAQRAEVEAVRAEVAAELAHVELDVAAPEDAEVEVRLDGERVAPTALLRLDPGEHVLTATAQRYRTHEERFTLRRGEERTLSVTMALLPRAMIGRVVLEATEPEHVVAIEGVAQAEGRLERELARGEYTVAVSDGVARESQRIDVLGGDTLRLRLGLGSSAPRWVWVITALGAAAVVGGGLALGFAVTRDQRAPQPVSDEVFGTIATLRGF